MVQRASTRFIVAMCWLFCLLATAGIAVAQESTVPEAENTSAAQDQYAPGPDAECPGAVVVQTLSGDDDRQSTPFAVQGDSVRVTNTFVDTGTGLAFLSTYLVDAQ